MRGSARLPCGARSPTNLRKRPAPACLSTPAPATANPLRDNCRARCASCTRKPAMCCRACSMRSASSAAFCSVTVTALQSPRSTRARCRIIACAAGTLREKLKRWHADVDCAFRSWSEPWLDPQFRNWDITDALGYIRVPMLIVQGENDQYGTLRQIEVAKEECYSPVEAAILPGIRHDPCREAPGRTIGAAAEFINRLFRDHHEGEHRARSGVAAS